MISSRPSGPRPEEGKKRDRNQQPARISGREQFYRGNNIGNYDQFAQEYAKGTEELEEATRRYFYSLLPELKRKALLDIGCGSGHDAAYYASEGSVVYGVDIFEKELAMALEKVSGVFIQASMEQLPFEAAKFDLVTIFYAIQHTEDVPKTLLEMIRVAKPGGVIMVLAKNPFRNLLKSHVNDGNSGGGSNPLIYSISFDIVFSHYETVYGNQMPTLRSGRLGQERPQRKRNPALSHAMHAEEVFRMNTVITHGNPE